MAQRRGYDDQSMTFRTVLFGTPPFSAHLRN